MKDKGIVVKLKDTHCIVLSKNGTYHRVPLPRNGNIRVGAETEFSTVNWFHYVKPALMVATLLILVLGFGLFRKAAAPEAFAYVSLDINPSVELEVDKNLKVLSMHPLNDDAKRLLSKVQVRNAELYTSINSIMAEAVQEGYLKPGQKNYVLSTITLNNSSSAKINYDSFAQNMETAVQNKDLDIKIVILSTDIALRNEAAGKGLSTGKLAVYKDAVTSGDKVTLEQVKENSITQLVNIYKIKLLPNNKKLIIKSMEIPPRGSNIPPEDTKHGEFSNIDEKTDETGLEKDNPKHQNEDSIPKQDEGNNRHTGKNRSPDNNINRENDENGFRNDTKEVKHETDKKGEPEKEQNKEYNQEKDRERNDANSGDNHKQGQGQTPAPSERPGHITPSGGEGQPSSSSSGEGQVSSPSSGTIQIN
ncbi:MAG: anti-sigma-I factor RsgI family protein [Eubacteriales bacterium]